MSSIAPTQHTRRKGQTTDDWITPKWLIDRLGLFDLDPCACKPQPWPCAKEQMTDNGLISPWNGMVYVNPPYGLATAHWLERLAHHGNGMALVFARTETNMFFYYVWPMATALLFIRGRLTFCKPSGEPAEHNSGGPSVLIAYGDEAAARFLPCEDLGKIVLLKGLK